ncbi:MAG: hypothetical protein ABF491_14830, partial [Acetobacter sp.]|uniref:hypothetical protein n=1 Tax=Acetobacter sp. TaxID=440 RepID=UPI0039EC394B
FAHSARAYRVSQKTGRRENPKRHLMVPSALKRAITGVLHQLGEDTIGVPASIQTGGGKNRSHK